MLILGRNWRWSVSLRNTTQMFHRERVKLVPESPGKSSRVWERLLLSVSVTA